MRKILHILCILTLTILCSCQNSHKDFNLDLDGSLQDSTVNVEGSFKMNVSNIAIDSIDIADTLLISGENGRRIDSWVNNYINNNIVSKIGPTSSYYFTVTGYVLEESTKNVYKIDKVFTNNK